MKNEFRITVSFVCLVLAGCHKQPTPQVSAPQSNPVAASTAYTYESVPGDSLKARVYTLKNGLKVHLTDYKNAPRVQTYIAVRAGSKNDPATATGLAHYLEHMVFKGTSKFGTINWEKEKTELDKIESLYNTYRSTTDPVVRKKIYHQIDSVSGVAAKYAIANEYDKMVGNIGVKGSNAYTYLEQTVYTGDVPANQLERWAKIEAERFGELVPRLFHTELEAVYEEKNRSLDSDESKAYEALYEALYPNHPYGTQTTIGTIEHLKNPSITEIKRYFDKYYVPNNIAICLSGDLDMDKTIQIIDRYFGSLKSKPVPEWKSPHVPANTPAVTREVYGPNAEYVMVGYRAPGIASKDAQVLEMISKILSNNTAGMLDLNLAQKQKVLGAYAYAETNHDYANLVLSSSPREGQKLEEVRALLLAEIEKLKKGEFDDQLIQSIKTNRKVDLLRSFESNSARANAFVSAFILGQSWAEYVHQEKAFQQITKAQVTEVANRLLVNEVTIYKRSGTKNESLKVEKPEITPVTLNRDAVSDFHKQVLQTPAPPVKPAFIDYKTAITETKLPPNIPVYSLKNTENELFTLYYLSDIGNNHDPKIGLAIQYLSFLGDEGHTAEEFKKALYALGCTFNVFSGDDQVYVSLTGPDENMEKSLALFENHLLNPKPNKKALTDMVEGILKDRKDAKLNKGVILQQAMVNYAKYGPKNPFTNTLSEKELRALKPEELLNIIKGLTSYEHRVLYYGPRGQAKLLSALQTEHKVPATLKPVPKEIKFKQLPFQNTQVFWADYDMVQAEIVFLSKSMQFKKELVPTTRIFNEYFGGGMGSVVFQELREARALAYSAYSNYAEAAKKEEANYILSYIGTQADKLPEAMAGMTELLNQMPLTELNLSNAKEGIRNKISSERITRTSVLFDYERAKKLGLEYDIRKDIYQTANAMTLDDLKSFQQQYIKGQPQKILVIGSRKNLNFKELKKYGPVKELSLKELFGY